MGCAWVSCLAHGFWAGVSGHTDIDIDRRLVAERLGRAHGHACARCTMYVRDGTLPATAGCAVSYLHGIERRGGPANLALVLACASVRPSVAHTRP